MTSLDGQKTNDEASHTAFDPEERTWGDCTYAMLLVRVNWAGRSPDAGELYIFVPELGFALLNGGFVNEVNFEAEPPVSITRIPPGG
jgi:hypothetical protein